MKRTQPIPDTADSGNLQIGRRGGGSFVDVQLGVKVLFKTGTMFAFDPERLHGTTELEGAESYGVSLAFSQRLIDCFDKESFIIAS